MSLIFREVFTSNENFNPVAVTIKIKGVRNYHFLTPASLRFDLYTQVLFYDMNSHAGVVPSYAVPIQSMFNPFSLTEKVINH